MSDSPEQRPSSDKGKERYYSYPTSQPRPSQRTGTQQTSYSESPDHIPVLFNFATVWQPNKCRRLCQHRFGGLGAQIWLGSLPIGRGRIRNASKKKWIRKGTDIVHLLSYRTTNTHLRRVVYAVQYSGALYVSKIRLD